MDTEHVIWPIKIHTFGRFTLIKNREPIRLSSKTQKPIELLKAVLAAGGREVCVGLMMDALWPDADGDAAHNALNVTMHRLRKLLGDHDAIHLHDNKLTIDPQTCWVDAWEFERLLNALEFLLKARQPCPQEIRPHTEKLFGLCQGTFLKGETGGAVIAARERLCGRFLHALDAIGQYWERTGNWEQAGECYQKGLEINPMLESLYQRLMICHREMGQRAEALNVYRRCHDTLSSLLNIPPSRHTEDIRRSLIAG